MVMSMTIDALLWCQIVLNVHYIVLNPKLKKPLLDVEDFQLVTFDLFQT